MDRILISSKVFKKDKNCLIIFELRSSSEAYLKPCHTSMTKLHHKYLTGF